MDSSIVNAAGLLTGTNVSIAARSQTLVPQTPLPEGLVAGTVVQLKAVMPAPLLEGGSLFKLNILVDSTPVPVEVRLSAPLRAEVAVGQVQEFSAKVMADGSLQILPKTGSLPSENSVRSPDLPSAGLASASSSSSTQPAIVMPTAVKMPAVSIVSVRVADVIGRLMAELEFPPQLQENVFAALPQGGLLLTLKDIGGDVQDNQNLLRPLKEVLTQIRSTDVRQPLPESLRQELAQSVQQLVGKQFTARILPALSRETQTALTSPLGRLWTELPIRIPSEIPLQFEISQIPDMPSVVPQVSASLLKTAAVLLSELLPVAADESFALQPQTLLTALQKNDSQVADILKIFVPLVVGKGAEPRLAAEILQNLPGLKPDVLSNTYSFLKAARSGKASDWLGTDLTAKIASAPRGAETLAQVETILTSALRETPLWRVADIPFFNGMQIVPLQVAFKKDREAEPSEPAAQKSGLRFMVTTEFSKLGAFQFDGFAAAKERRFDLIVRTSAAQNRDFCAQIMSLFKKSLQEVEYTGSIKINQREAFIRLSEPSAQPRQGVFV